MVIIYFSQITLSGPWTANEELPRLAVLSISNLLSIFYLTYYPGILVNFTWMVFDKLTCMGLSLKKQSLKIVWLTRPDIGNHREYVNQENNCCYPPKPQFHEVQMIMHGLPTWRNTICMNAQYHVLVPLTIMTNWNRVLTPNSKNITMLMIYWPSLGFILQVNRDKRRTKSLLDGQA